MSLADCCTIPVLYRFRSVEHHVAMRVWLSENIDPACYDAEDWNFPKLGDRARNIWFAREQDAVWFSLKWA